MRRGLLPTREQAQAAITAGRVTVGGAPAATASRLVDPAEAVVVASPRARFVSRGGEKLAAALDHFVFPVAGRDALDAGASTGGFTDCLLQRDAARVTAVDVGRGQIHQRLRHHPRVTTVERTNVRYLDLDALSRPDEPFDLVVADLSFISLALVAPPLLGMTGPSADLVVLIKPQFEAGRRDADRGRGVITDPEVWRRAVRGVRAAFADQRAAMMGVMVSPLLGARGNVEFLAHLVAGRPDDAVGDLTADDAIDDAIDDAVARRAARQAG